MGATFRLFTIVQLIGCALLSVSHAQESPAPKRPFASALGDCEPPPLDAAPETIADWSKVIDYLHDKYERKTEEKDDVRLPFGTVIGANCLTGARKEKAKQTLDRFKEVVGRMLEQAYRCDKTLGITAAADVIAIVRRARITCNPDAPQHGATNRTMKYRPGVAPFTAVKANYDRSYEINVPPHTIDDEPFSVETTASYLFHEGLHSAGLNNQPDWHDDPYKNGRTPEGCENSIFEDRVYFTHSICFPKSDYGYQLRAVVRDCPKVCRTAMTYTKRSAGFAQGKGSGTIFGVTGGGIGPDLNAVPMTAQEAEILCNRIVATPSAKSSIYRGLLETENEITMARGRLRDTPLYPTDDSKETRALSTKLLDLSRMTERLNRAPYDWQELSEAMSAAEADIGKLIEATCANPARPKSWTDTCALKGSYILKEIATWTSRVKDWARRAKQPAPAGLGFPPDILKFYD